jgi:hypothetical protein
MYHTRRIPIRRARIANARKIHAKSTLPKQKSLQTARIARARSKTPTQQRDAVARATRCFVQTIGRLQLVAWCARLASPRARWKCCNKLKPCTPASSSSSREPEVQNRARPPQI